MKNFVEIFYGTRRCGIMAALTAVLSYVALMLWQEEHSAIVANALFLVTVVAAFSTLVVAVYSVVKMYTTQRSDEAELRLVNDVFKPYPVERLRFFAVCAVGALMASMLVKQFRFSFLFISGQLPAATPILVLLGINFASSVVTIGVSVMYLIYLKWIETIVLEAVMHRYEKMKKMSGE